MSAIYRLAFILLLAELLFVPLAYQSKTPAAAQNALTPPPRPWYPATAPGRWPSLSPHDPGTYVPGHWTMPDPRYWRWVPPQRVWVPAHYAWQQGYWKAGPETIRLTRHVNPPGLPD